MSDFTDHYAHEAAKFKEGYDKLTEFRAHAPHCDERVLHAPGTCWACDGYPDWQQARITQGINFTEEEDPTKAPCPARLRRPLDTINRWHGNVAETPEEAGEATRKWYQRLGLPFLGPDY